MYMILQVHDIDYDHISFIFGKPKQSKYSLYWVLILKDDVECLFHKAFISK